MFSLFHRVMSATGLYFYLTFPLSAILIFFLTVMSTDSGVEGAIYFSAMLPIFHFVITLICYGAVLGMNFMFKEEMKKENLVELWHKNKVVFVIATVLVVMFGGVPFLVVLGGMLFVPWISERMKRWHGLLLIFLSVSPYLLFLAYFLVFFL